MQAGREIKFRGKRIDNGEWVYGCYSYLKSPLSEAPVHYIIEGGFTPVEVEPETVGQFTGLGDMSENEIYEKDIALIFGDRCVIEYDSNSAAFVGRTQIDSYWALDEETFKLGVEVIGNIYENPELLEVGNNASRT